MNIKKIVLAVALMLGMAAVPAQASKLAAGLGIAGAIGVLASYLPVYKSEGHGESHIASTDIKLQALRETVENYENKGYDVTVSEFKVLDAKQKKFQDKSYADCANMSGETSTSYTIVAKSAFTTISPWCNRLFWGGLGAMALAVGLSI